MDTALPIWNRVVPWTVILRNIISDRDLKFNAELWRNLHQFFATKVSFFTAYHPQNDGPAEGMIQILEEMVRRLCEYGLDFKDFDGFTHNWYILLPALKLPYKTSLYADTNQTPAIL
ncbi:hypothetical protein O181_101379 [Austropuccinia psidii MF-1]|uniref:Integrase catalytic domain-containing protein n=1 Tax=Austropuccinia psidii MF-1 TaxID=1389203 RepID=A0A9Q3PH95_9BASI|nr:hypothetical protein [Austropuccinia psidii MF-1]